MIFPFDYYDSIKFYVTTETTHQLCLLIELSNCVENWWIWLEVVVLRLFAWCGFVTYKKPFFVAWDRRQLREVLQGVQDWDV